MRAIDYNTLNPHAECLPFLPTTVNRFCPQTPFLVVFSLFSRTIVNSASFFLLSWRGFACPAQFRLHTSETKETKSHIKQTLYKGPRTMLETTPSMY